MTKCKGFRPEPIKPEHWRFENLKPRLFLNPTVTETSGNVDLRPFSSPRHNQLDTGSCVANGVIKALEIKRIIKYGMSAHVDLSRLAVYYLARELMDPQETDKDEGTYVSLACDVLRRWGVCPETEWPFDVTKVLTSPSWLSMRTTEAFMKRKCRAKYATRAFRKSMKPKWSI